MTHHAEDIVFPHPYFSQVGALLGWRPSCAPGHPHGTALPASCRAATLLLWTRDGANADYRAAELAPGLCTRFAKRGGGGDGKRRGFFACPDVDWPASARAIRTGVRRDSTRNEHAAFPWALSPRTCTLNSVQPSDNRDGHHATMRRPGHRPRHFSTLASYIACVICFLLGRTIRLSRSDRP